MDTKIVLIVGPSGVGKDTLLRKLKSRVNIDINFVNRYITRLPDKNESNYYLDDYAFELLKHNGLFISTWSAHDNLYGIAKNSIQNGLNIISISRSKIRDFENYIDNVYTINITVPKDILRHRLETRGRENSLEIEKRLNRSYEKIEANRLIEFDNSKDIETSAKDFICLIKSL